MYKLIIVDDEMLVQIGIKSMLDWEKEDIVISGIASNGEQAYELIKKEHIDIVITDIKMPVLDGIELIRKCKETLDFMPQFILLTSHEEFSFAKEAIKLNVVDYLIKLDLNVDVLLNAINNAKVRISKEKDIDIVDVEDDKNDKIEKIFKQVINKKLDKSLIVRSITEIDEDMTKDLFLLYFDVGIKNSDNLIQKEEERIIKCVEGTVNEIINKEHKGYTIPYQLNRFFGLVSIKDKKNEEVLKLNISELIERIIKVNREYFNVKLKVGCSSFGHTAEEMLQMYKEARTAFRYVNNEICILFYQDIEQDRREQKFDITLVSKEIVDAWEQRNVEKIKRIFEEIIQLFEETDVSVEQVKDCCNRLMYFIITEIESGDVIVERTIQGEQSFQYLNQLSTKSEFLDWLLMLSDSIVEVFLTEKNDYSERIVQKAKKYMLENKEAKLSLSEVAQVLEVNASYLSGLFKKYGKLGFLDYATKIKMDYAKELLEKDEYKIYEVANMLGYDNAYYFSKVFKKYTSMTPKEYVSTKSIEQKK